MTLSYIPADTDAEGILKAAASGVLPNGKPVVVNANGTVSVVAEVPQQIGTSVVFNAGYTQFFSSTFDSNSNKVVIAFRDDGDSGKGKAVVGTVDPSDNSISFGTEVQFDSSAVYYVSLTFDSNSNKVVIAYRDVGNSNYGTAIVGTVSGTNISFGTAAVFESATSDYSTATFDSTSNKVVIAYRDVGNSNYGTAIVGTVSGTNISFGSATVFENSSTFDPVAVFDSNSNKVVIAYRDGGNSSHGTSVVGTVSGTSITFGTPVVFEAAATNYLDAAFDSTANKVVFSFSDSSVDGRAIVGTISGTAISFGTSVLFTSARTLKTAAVYDSSANKVVITYENDDNNDYGTFVNGEVVGTSIVFNSPEVFRSSAVSWVQSTFDSNSNRVVTSFWDAGNSNYGGAVVLRTVNSNLTAENYIGMSSGVADVESGTQAIGSPTVFESATSASSSSTFDSSSNKVVIAYRDGGNSQHGTAVVGTVSGTSISFGSPVVFNSSASYELSTTFDSNSNKVVIAYQDAGNSFKGTAIVGTVSGTAISFGSSVVFSSADAAYTSSIFDNSSNKVVIAYANGTASGNAIVGTISGTAISFGTTVVFNSSRTTVSSATFDSSNNKVVIAYNDYSNSQRGTARVGTVSGTGISFGTAVIFEANASHISSAFDSSSNKIVISYDFYNGSASLGTAIVGTVSGTGISFGTSVTFNAAATAYTSATFDSNSSRVVIAYYNGGNSNYGTAIVGTISGTGISFGDAVVFESAASTYISSTFDSNSNKVVIAYTDGGNSSYGTSVVFQPGFTNITRGEVPSGSQAITNIIGSVSSIQTGLTAGQSYFVQTDGTIGTTAASPSVFAGTAISATKLIVKT